MATTINGPATGIPTGGSTDLSAYSTTTQTNSTIDSKIASAVALLPAVYESAGPATPVAATTTEQIIAAVKIPAGTIGQYGRVDVEGKFTATSGNANGKILRTRLGANATDLGGMILNQPSSLTSISEYVLSTGFANNASQAVQRGTHSLTSSGLGTATSTNPVGTINTANDCWILFTVQMAAATDTVGLDSFKVTVSPKTAP